MSQPDDWVLHFRSSLSPHEDCASGIAMKRLQYGWVTLAVIARLATKIPGTVSGEFLMYVRGESS
jgi:hypothetical protein